MRTMIEEVQCDLCSQKNVPGTKRIAATVDSRMDGAGSTEYIDDVTDLCPDCMRNRLSKLLQGMSWEERKKWFDPIIRRTVQSR